MLRQKPQMLKKKIQNRFKQNFQDEANNMQLYKEDTQRSNLNSKYLSATLVMKCTDYFICFYYVQSAYLLSTIWCHGTKLEETLSERLVSLKTFHKDWTERSLFSTQIQHHRKVLFTRKVIIIFWFTVLFLNHLRLSFTIWQFVINAQR